VFFKPSAIAFGQYLHKRGCLQENCVEASRRNGLGHEDINDSSQIGSILDTLKVKIATEPMVIFTLLAKVRHEQLIILTNF
jgi:hypothetical protein